jgi:hypothetical protein
MIHDFPFLLVGYPGVLRLRLRSVVVLFHCHPRQQIAPDNALTVSETDYSPGVYFASWRLPDYKPVRFPKDQSDEKNEDWDPMGEVITQQLDRDLFV